MWAATIAIAALYIGTTVLTPLYPMYVDAFGISQLTITMVYAVYVVGNLAVLFLFGRLSDQVGRRVTTLIALGLTVVSTLIFLFATGTPSLFVGRAINGFAAGLGAAAFLVFVALMLDALAFDAAMPARGEVRETGAGSLATRGRGACATISTSTSAGATTMVPRSSTSTTSTTPPRLAPRVTDSRTSRK